MKEHRPMPAALPTLNLIAEPGRRCATLDTAREIEWRGFACEILVTQNQTHNAETVAVPLGIAAAQPRVSGRCVPVL
jgi:hypothetical protein